VTATLIGSQTNPNPWRKKIEPTQKLYSWALNNHWHTNYRAYQEGPLVFRFVLRPHRGPCQDADASRLATSISQPLVALPGRGAPPPAESLLRVEPAEVHVVGLKPSDDGKALIVRLFGAGGKDAQARLTWPSGRSRRLWLSDTSERPLAEFSGAVPVPARGVVTVRAESTR
jgi:alpha-mannosidase